MIGPLRGVSVWAYPEPCDMRKSFNTLQALVEASMNKELDTGDLFLFVSRSRHLAKLLYFDGTGLCLLAKRIETGKFAAPWSGAMSRKLELTMSELALFFEGSQAIGRGELSPPLLQRCELRQKLAC